jgi:glycosyltransferase involved in cell wall biosynthesis
VSDQPLVSIAMAMRNSERTLGLALQSVLHQRYERWELILLDDGSTDGSVRIAQGLGDARVRVVVDGCSLGLAARLNQAVDMAGGKYVARMDADDIAYPERIGRQVAFLETHPEIDLLGTRAMAFDDTGAALGLLPFQPDHAGICARPWSTFPLPHPTWMGRRIWFQRYRYRVHALRAQDQDLLLRSHRDSRFACLPEVLLGYRQGYVSLRNTMVGRWHYARSLWREGFEARQPLLALRGIATQFGRGAAASGAVLLGLRQPLLRRRFLPATAAQVADWNQCRERLWEALV